MSARLIASVKKCNVDNTLKSVATMDMMGQSMELNSDAVMINQVEVKDKKDTSYTIASTLTKMTTNGSVMGQSYSFDSDKKQDRDSSELGKMLKDQLNVPREIELNSKGQLLNKQKTDAPAEAGANPMMGMMKSIYHRSGNCSAPAPGAPAPWSACVKPASCSVPTTCCAFGGLGPTS